MKSRMRLRDDFFDSELDQERLAIEKYLMKFQDIDTQNKNTCKADDSLTSLGLGIGIKIPKHLSNKERIKSAITSRQKSATKASKQK